MENLDGLRFIACFLVVSQHACSPLINRVAENSGFLSWPLKKILAQGGELGVSFFFVLSGFLITLLILTEIKIKGHLDVLSFYMRRALRIWPLYYLVVVFAIIVYPRLKALFGHSEFIQIGNTLSYFVFLGNFDVISLGLNRGAMSTNITWSVAIEEQFYLVWPILFYFSPVRFYKYLFVPIIVVSTLFRAANSDNAMIVYFHSLSVISDMAVGGLAAYLSISDTRFVSFFRHLARVQIILFYAGGITVVLFSERLYGGNSVLFATVYRLTCSLFFAFAILEQNYSDRSFYKMSNFSLISKIGKYTYGLYLLHPIAIQFCMVGVSLSPFVPTGLCKDLSVAVGSVVISSLLAFASYHWYERPFLRLKSRFSPI